MLRFKGAEYLTEVISRMAGQSALFFDESEGGVAERIVRAIIAVFFLVLPVLLILFVSKLASVMRWNLGSPLLPGDNWTRWSHIYLIFGIAFSLVLYAPVLMSVFIKQKKILFVPILAVILFIIASVFFAGYSRDMYFRQTLTSLDRQLAVDPQNADLLEDKANLFSQKAQYSQAIELYTEALKTTANPAYTLHDRGLAYFKSGSIDLAIQDLTQAMATKNGTKEFVARCYNDRGVAYFYASQFDLSARDAKQALESGYRVHPGFLSALEKKGYKVK